MIPGEIITGDDEHVLNDGLPVTTIAVANRGDRPIQVGSHYHFAETNAALLFDRKAAYGQRLDIPSGTAVRFEPRQTRAVSLIPYPGGRTVIGFRAMVTGVLVRRPIATAAPPMPTSYARPRVPRPASTQKAKRGNTPT